MISDDDLQEVLYSAAAEIARAVESVSDGSAASEDTARAASRLLSAACRAYSIAATGREAESFAQQLEMSTAEACVAATALLHSQSLSPFEFGIWFVASEARA